MRHITNAHQTRQPPPHTCHTTTTTATATATTTTTTTNNNKQPPPNTKRQTGALGIAELQQVLRDASKEFSHLEEHARFLDERSNRFGGLMKRFVGGIAAEGSAANSPL